MSDIAIVGRMLNGVEIGQRKADGYFDATAMCKANKRSWSDYARLEKTKEYLAFLASDLGIPMSELVEVRVGNAKSGAGTWVHPDVAVNLAQWLSPKFALQVSRWVRELMTTGRVEILPPEIQGDTLLNAIEAVRQLRLSQIATERAAAAAKAMAESAQRTATAALCQAENNHGCFQVIGWARLMGLEMTEGEASKHGRAIATICRSRGIPVAQQKHQRYGSVNLYPESVLREYFGDPN